MVNFLSDALSQVYCEPQCATIWHRLYEHWTASTNEVERDNVVRSIMVKNIEDPKADILRLTFLFGATSDYRYLREAASKTLALRPENPDRLAGMMGYIWGLSVRDIKSHDGLFAWLTEFEMPEFALKLSDIAQSCMPDLQVKKTAGQIERVAIIAPCLGDRFHTPSQIVIDQCDVLATEGRRIHIFCCQELQPVNQELFNGSAALVMPPPFDAAFWQTVLPQGTSLTVSSTSVTLFNRWREMFPQIVAFAPDAVLLCGFFSPLAAALYQQLPVVALNVHALPPLTPHDVWLSSENSSDYEYPWSRVITPPERYHHPYRIKEKKSKEPVSRESLGIASDAIIWLTVGWRLANEIVNPWAASIGELLKEHQNVIWVLVGTEGALINSLKSMPPNQIKALGRRDDVQGLLQISDVYVNPPRLGGGYSVSESMSAALPVVSFAHSDGGDKIGSHAVKTTAEYLALLYQLTASQAFRCEIGERQRDMFKARLDLASSGPSLLSAFEKADQHARCRIRSLL